MSEKIKCPYCGEETSTAFTHCEKCNKRLKGESSGAGVFKFLMIVFIVIGIILTIVMSNAIGVMSLAYLVACLIVSAFMYGTGRIIDLLYQIKCNTDK